MEKGPARLESLMDPVLTQRWSGVAQSYLGDGIVEMKTVDIKATR